ncbi:cytochrome P450 2K1-like isoform X1 [Xyrauchen texanus]|uniref:cytochrome P450 2K1-like isoform X1 n=1 Tax=Xyrauchen texanus TaxID=154827 RepID=UPI002241C944|nr:cytochrome P450 2K1-like isoform X1 [Xyrauchen texanus]
MTLQIDDILRKDPKDVQKSCFLFNKLKLLPLSTLLMVYLFERKLHPGLTQGPSLTQQLAYKGLYAADKHTVFNCTMAVFEALLQFPSMGTLLGALLLLLVVYLLSSGSKPQKEGKDPPGPKPLPLLGNLLTLDLERPFDTLCELSKTYGNVFQVFLGPKKVVVLAGYKTVKEALVNYADEFGDREIGPNFRILNDEHGIIFSNGENWKEMRRFALTNLRDFGMGKRGSEEKIIEEIQYLKEEFEKFEGKPFDTTQPVNYAVSNIISAIVYGSRFEYTDPRFKEMVDRANENVRVGGSASMMLYSIFPWLGPFLNSKRIIVRNILNNRAQINKLISGLLETLNPQDRRGFIDSFLIRKQSDEQSGKTDSYFHQENLIMTVVNLFVAGTDTTGTTLRWGLMIMAKYPHIQDRVQEEIDRVIGGRQPMVEDRKKLPYTDAVIHETQRLANIVPMNLPHTTSCDVHFNGYFIKKGTSVFPLLTSVLKDESEWEKPHSFYPEHFLDDKGQFVKKDAFMPFSAGRRVCAGEGLARMELFLFFASLLQHFRFTPPPGVSGDELDLRGIVGITLNPSPHNLCAIKRS